MSSSIQNDKFGPKLPAAMIVKVLGTNKSVCGMYPLTATGCGCFALQLKLPSYRNDIGIEPGISPGYTASGKASFCALEPSKTGSCLTNNSSSLGNLKPFFLNASPKSFNSG